MSQYPLGLYPVYLPCHVKKADRRYVVTHRVEVFPLEPLSLVRRDVAVYQSMLRNGELPVDLLVSKMKTIL